MLRKTASKFEKSGGARTIDERQPGNLGRRKMSLSFVPNSGTDASIVERLYSEVARSIT
jgi:hypothetical protein